MSERDYHDRHYESDAAAIQGTPLFRRVHERSARHFLRVTGCGPTHRVLSLGCGDGTIERHLAPHVGEIVGIDVSSVAIAQARDGAAAAGLRNLSFQVSEEGAPRLAELGRFDCIAGFAFLHHLTDEQIAQTFAAAHAALPAGGCFYSSDPSTRRLIGLFTRLVRKTYERFHSPEERELEPEWLARMAAQAGLQPTIHYVDYFLGPLAWLAPHTPRAVVPALAGLDATALALPLARRYASSFSVLARRR
jgi:cyclopropane fatty-acyl-phospholipid synthase-like methyltransferase